MDDLDHLLDSNDGWPITPPVPVNINTQVPNHYGALQKCPKEALKLEFFNLDTELCVKAQFVQGNSGGLYKAEDFLLPSKALARFSQTRLKLIILKQKKSHLDELLGSLDLERVLPLQKGPARQSPAELASEPAQLHPCSPCLGTEPALPGQRARLVSGRCPGGCKIKKRIPS